MSEGVFIRMSKKDKKEIDQDRKLKGIESQNEYVVRALRHFRKCDKTTTKLRGMERIFAPIDWECMKCKKKGKVGEEIVYGTSGIMCPECWVGKLGDKRTADLIMRKRELKYDLKALKNEKERAAQELDEIQYVMLVKESIERDKTITQHNVKMNERNAELNSLCERYIKQSFSNEEEKKLFGKIKQTYELLMSEREEWLKEREEQRASNDRANVVYRKFTMRKKKKVKPAIV